MSRGHGVFLHVDESTNFRSQLDVSRILVSVEGLQKIDNVSSVNIGDNVFDIRLKDEGEGVQSYSLPWLCGGSFTFD